MRMLNAPFPYFGGKAKIAHEIWEALGQPKHYIEPFFGSGAVLLNRPNWSQKMVETVNDKDGFLSNCWRALQQNPDAVAKVCDWPVNHAALATRKKYLIEHEAYLLAGLQSDPKWFDAELAGYWIWAASCWIGSGLTRLGQIPHISDGGKGVHKIGQIPHISHGGKGVQEPYNTNIYEWFRQLSERLRYVRVVCGDWTRVCGGNWQDGMGTVGMFFDPPYGVGDRDTAIYYHDSVDIAADVLVWCRKRGRRESYRIVLAGYEEYQELLNEGWTIQKWKANGSYSATGNNEQGKNNRYRETLYLSPYCIKNQKQKSMFD